MKVRELIEVLNSVKDKELEVAVFFKETSESQLYKRDVFTTDISIESRKMVTADSGLKDEFVQYNILRDEDEIPVEMITIE